MTRGLIQRVAGSLSVFVWALLGVGASAEIHEVTVGDNFFSPAALSVAIGDTVRWTNAAGIHNVFSCTDSQNFCDGKAATESFGNGPPRAGLWVYAYTFTQSGANTYLCQSHASFMRGEVTVQPLNPSPPVVPDGTNGAPMIVGRSLADPVVLKIMWDTESCGPSAGYHLLVGTRASFPLTAEGAYSLLGSVCVITPPLNWSAPEVRPGTFIWWLVIANDGIATEGSWGKGLFGERNGLLVDGASGQCGASGKLASECAP